MGSMSSAAHSFDMMTMTDYSHKMAKIFGKGHVLNKDDMKDLQHVMLDFFAFWCLNMFDDVQEPSIGKFKNLKGKFNSS